MIWHSMASGKSQATKRDLTSRFVGRVGILAYCIVTALERWLRPSESATTMKSSPPKPEPLPPPLPAPISQPRADIMRSLRIVSMPLEHFLNELLRTVGDVPISMTFPDAVFDSLVVEFRAHERMAVDPAVGFVELVLNVGPRKCQLLRATNPDRALAGMRCARCHMLYKRAEHESVDHVEILGLCMGCKNKGVKQ